MVQGLPRSVLAKDLLCCLVSAFSEFLLGLFTYTQVYFSKLGVRRGEHALFGTACHDSWLEYEVCRAARVKIRTVVVASVRMVVLVAYRE